MSKIPEKGELDELCLTKSTVEIGKIYGVSDKTIRNWIRKLGIDYKKKSGYNLNDEECRRKSKEALKLYFKTNRNCNRKEIVRCSLSGELIKAYEAIVDVRGDGFVDEMIRRTLKNDKRTYRGFLWATKSEFEKGIFAKPGIAPHF